VSRRRAVAALVLGAVIAAGLVVHLALPDTTATDIAGDTLYPLAAMAALVVVAPRWHPLFVGGIALAWCLGVELFQLTGVPLAAADAFPPAVLLLGTVFDARDLLVYAVTIAVATAVDAAVTRRRAPELLKNHP
jgi:hypothetical protein